MRVICDEKTKDFISEPNNFNWELNGGIDMNKTEITGEELETLSLNILEICESSKTLAIIRSKLRKVFPGKDSKINYGVINPILSDLVLNGFIAKSQVEDINRGLAKLKRQHRSLIKNFCYQTTEKGNTRLAMSKR